MDLYYKQYGENRPPLIILHGLLGSSGNWHTLSRSVFSDVATVYTLDQRNHGRSPHADRFDYPSMARDVRAFIADQGLGSATVLGHSMGGKTAMHLALEAPDVVDRLIIADMAPRAYPPHHRPLLDALQSLDLSAHDSRSDIDDALAEDVASLPMRQFLLKNLNYNGETYTWQMNLDVIANQYDNVNAAVAAATTFDKPTLVVRGEHSDYITEADMEHIRTLFPNAQSVVIPDADHWVHADAPEAFAEAVLDFLAASEPSASA
jgi:pimeloyl-ACP methyl ester carboxylesterase